MESKTDKIFNRNLLLAALALNLSVFISLLIKASTTNNWKGFLFSYLHLLIVTIASLHLLKK